MKLRGEPKKPIAFICGDPDLSPKIIAGYVDGSIRVYDLTSSQVDVTFRLPPPIGSKRGASPAPTCAVGFKLPASSARGGGNASYGREGREAVVAIGDVTGRVSLWPIRAGSVYDKQPGFGGGGFGGRGGFGGGGGFGSDEFDDGDVGGSGNGLGRSEGNQ